MVALVVVVFTAAALHTTPASSSTCTTHYSLASFKSYANFVYSRRIITRGMYARLGRLGTCNAATHAAVYRYRVYKYHQWAFDRNLTTLRIAGGTSTFGSPAEGDSGVAGRGSSAQPCIALRDTSTLNRYFLVTVNGHRAVLIHCDSGPYAGGRVMDITGHGLIRLGISPYNYDNYYGTAQMLRRYMPVPLGWRP